MARRSALIRTVLGLFLFCTLPVTLYAQLLDQGGIADTDIKPTDVIIWETVSASQATNKEISVGFRLTTRENFSIYATNLKFNGPSGYTVAAIKGPKTVRIKDPIKGDEVDVYGPGDFEVTFAGLDTWKEAQFPFSITFLGCTERICLFPYTQDFSVALFQATSPKPDATTEVKAPDTTAQEEVAVAARTAITPAGDDLGQTLAKKFGTGGDMPLWLLFMIVFLGGLATNLTPCVAPMFPITARILAKRPGSSSLHSLAYSLGIIVSYSVLGLVVVFTGGFFGAVMAHPLVNLAYAVLFVLLTFAMLGFINLTALQNIGARIGNNGQGPTSTFLMGTAAGLVAAPCTGPVFGALLAYTANNPQQPTANALLMVFYASGFGMPYLFIGMAFKRIAQIRVNPLIQNTVKILFSAAIFGLAFYYLRIPLYEITMQMKPYWNNVFIVTGIVGIIALITTVKIWQNRDAKKLALIPTLSLGLALFALSQKLTTTDTTTAAPGTKISWIYNEEELYAQAKAANKPIIVDNWAEWCEACKKMDVTTFADPTVIGEIQANWMPLKLDLTLDDDKADVIKEKFKLSGLPTLVMLPPDGDVEKMQKIVGEVSASSLLEAMRAFRGQ